jgi:Domain of unknown function (DUF4293)
VRKINFSKIISMIQRIQTVFLLLALIAIGLFLWMPLIRLEAPHFPVREFQGWDIYYRAYGYLFFINGILSGTAAGLTLINIFLFKNRALQMLLCWFAIVLIVFAQAYVYYDWQTYVFFGEVVLRKWNLFSFVAILFEILAFAYIRKDEEMIKGMDRLR